MKIWLLIPLLDYSVMSTRIVQHDVRASVGIIHKLHTFSFLSDFSVLECNTFKIKMTTSGSINKTHLIVKFDGKIDQKGWSPNWVVYSILKIILGLGIVLAFAILARNILHEHFVSIDALTAWTFCTGRFWHRDISATWMFWHGDVTTLWHFGNILTTYVCGVFFWMLIF